MIVLKPDIQPFNSTRYVIAQRFEFYFYDKKYAIEIGFITDGASISRFLWSIIGHPYLPEFIGSAVIHDFMYAYHLKYGFSKHEADIFFKNNLILNGVSEYKAYKMYKAVDLFGGKAWKQHENKNHPVLRLK